MTELEGIEVILNSEAYQRWFHARYAEKLLEMTDKMFDPSKRGPIENEDVIRGWGLCLKWVCAQPVNRLNQLKADLKEQLEDEQEDQGVGHPYTPEPDTSAGLPYGS